MRKLNITTEIDGKEKSLTFTALRASEARAIRKADSTKEERKRARERERILEKQEDNKKELTDKELDFLDECEDKSIERLINIIRKSLEKVHKEYAVKGNREEDEKINKVIEDSFDFNTLSVIAEFAISGTISRQEEDVVIEDITIG